MFNGLNSWTISKPREVRACTNWLDRLRAIPRDVSIKKYNIILIK